MLQAGLQHAGCILLLRWQQPVAPPCGFPPPAFLAALVFLGLLYPPTFVASKARPWPRLSRLSRLQPGTYTTFSGTLLTVRWSPFKPSRPATPYSHLVPMPQTPCVRETLLLQPLIVHPHARRTLLLLILVLTARGWMVPNH